MLHGQIDIRIEVDTPFLDTSEFGIWGTSDWGESTWAAEDPEWTDVTEYVLAVETTSGRARWEQRFTAGQATVTLDNTTGIWTPDSDQPTPWYLPWRPGRRMRILAIPDPTDSQKVPLFTGTVDATNDQFTDGGHHITTVARLMDAMALLHGHNPIALETPTGVQATHERVEAALDRAGWPEDKRDIREGEHTMQSSYLAQSVLEECQRASEAEGGAFFIDPSGIAVFRPRDWLVTDERSTVVWGYLGYDPIDEDANYGEIVGVQPFWEIERIRNDIQYARVGSTVQSAEDSPSITLYQRQSYRRLDFQNNSDIEVLFLARRALAGWKDNRMRLDSVTIVPRPDPTNSNPNQLLWDTQYGDLFAIRVATGQGWEYERETHVMGISHRITADDWEVTFALDDSGMAGAADRELLVPVYSPEAWWQLTEVGGTTSADATGNGHTLTWSGGAALVGTGGEHGTGMVTLDGSNDYATVGSDSGLDIDEYTLEAWVQPRSGASGVGTILSHRGSSGPLYDLYWNADTNQFTFYPGASAGSGVNFVFATAPDMWHHIAVSVELVGSGIRAVGLAIDGFWIGYDFAYIPGAESRSMRIGRRAVIGDLYFDGDLGEVVVYDRALTQSELLNLYNAHY